MKKTLLVLACGLGLLLGQACKKIDTNQDVNETVNVTISNIESYKYSLPSSDNTSFGVETPSAKSAVVGIQNSGNSSSFIYTPAQNYSGTDVVIISNSGGQQGSGGCGHHHGNGGCNSGGCGSNSGGSCGGGNHHHHGKCHDKGKAKHTITFNITVTGTVN